MKSSTFIHGVAIFAGIWGMLALIAAWAAGDRGTALGFSQLHLYIDAIVLVLISISAGVCAIYRRQLEHET